MVARAEMIEVAAVDEVDPFHDVGTPAETYELRFDGSPVGQLVRDATKLKGMRPPTCPWVLVQKDSDLVLAAATREEAVERARRIVAARLGAGELTRGGTASRPSQGRKSALPLGALLVAAAALLYVLRARRR